MENDNPIVILVGVCGTGKGAVGQQLAKRLQVPFFDMDKFNNSKDQPKVKLPQNINMDKWLTCIEELILTQSSQRGCVLSCSILKKEHRKRLTTNSSHPLDWVFMNDSFENVAQRIKKIELPGRPMSLLRSDFDILEPPKRALTIDMTYSEQEIVDTILKYLARKYG